jgi:hypothetical protein
MGDVLAELDGLLSWLDPEQLEAKVLLNAMAEIERLRDTILSMGLTSETAAEGSDQ